MNVVDKHTPGRVGAEPTVRSDPSREHQSQQPRDNLQSTHIDSISHSRGRGMNERPWSTHDTERDHDHRAEPSKRCVCN